MKLDHLFIVQFLPMIGMLTVLWKEIKQDEFERNRGMKWVPGKEVVIDESVSRNFTDSYCCWSRFIFPLEHFNHIHFDDLQWMNISQCS